jgi:hypothetical protein
LGKLGDVHWFIGAKFAKQYINRMSRFVSSELGLTQSELARELVMKGSGVGYAIKRGEAIAAREQYTLIDTAN